MTVCVHALKPPVSQYLCSVIAMIYSMTTKRYSDYIQYSSNVYVHIKFKPILYVYVNKRRSSD